MILITIAGYVLAFTCLYCVGVAGYIDRGIRNDYIAGWFVCGGLALVCGIVLIFI